jgi:hypothetical protein
LEAEFAAKVNEQGEFGQRCPKISAEFDQKMAFPATLWLFA